MHRRRQPPATDGSDRAQSEVIGYALVFSIVILATTVAVLFGVTALDQIQSSTSADNGEMAMRAVAEDFEAFALGTATTRTAEVTLDSAALATGPRTSFNVTGKLIDQSTGNTVVKRSVNRTFRPLVYTSDGVDIVYTNSLIIRDQRRGAVAVNDPLLTASTNRTLIPVVATNASIQSVSGGTHQITSRRTASDGLSMTNVTSPSGTTWLTVNVSVETLVDRADVWERALEDELAGVPTGRSSEAACTQPSDTTVRCDFVTKRLTATGTNVTYELG